jgi:hypothetical protein
MDDLLEPEEKDLKKAKKIQDDDEAEFPEDNLDDDFLLDGKTKKKHLDDDHESLDDLAEDELDNLEEDSYDDVDEW